MSFREHAAVLKSTWRLLNSFMALCLICLSFYWVSQKDFTHATFDLLLVVFLMLLRREDRP